MDDLENLKFYAESGVDEVITNQPQNHFELSKKKEVVKKAVPAKKINDSEQLIDAKKAAESANNLEELRQAIESFDGLDIKKTANKTVFSDGVPNSEIMLIGEAPGASEDEQGIPFCGVSGKLLDQMFKAIGFERSKNFYITNTVFWRPPGNRRPTDEEIEICRPFVKKHIALIKPKMIILVGSTALNSVMPDVKETISKFRGKFNPYSNEYLEEDANIQISAIFHPSYLLRQGSKKRLAWQDLLKIKSKLN